jgi:hypothetical protein
VSEKFLAESLTHEYIDEDFYVCVDPRPPADLEEAALEDLAARIFRSPDPDSFFGAKFSWYGRWVRHLEFEVCIDPAAAPGNPFPALARVLRRLARETVNR